MIDDFGLIRVYFSLASRDIVVILKISLLPTLDSGGDLSPANKGSHINDGHGCVHRDEVNAFVWLISRVFKGKLKVHDCLTILDISLSNTLADRYHQ